MKIKSIGGTPQTVAFDARDVLVWIKCGDKSMGHPSFLITPYELTQGDGLKCPLCKGKEPIKAYLVRHYDDDHRLKKNGIYQYTHKEGAVTTIKEAKSRVDEVFKILKKIHRDARNNGLVMMDDIKPTCGECGEGMVTVFSDGTKLIGRMEGNYKGGIFSIDIIEIV
ncbi:hypothetical protein JCM17380_17010 [Desulfosporosinus burensis]